MRELTRKSAIPLSADAVRCTDSNHVSRLPGAGILRKNLAIIIAIAVIVVLAAIGAFVFLTQQPPAPEIGVSQTSASGTPPASSTNTVTTATSGANAGSSTVAGTDVAQAGSATPSIPGIVRNQHGDWQLSCDTPPGASFEQCAIIQNVTAEDQPNVGLSVIILKTADNKARLLRVLAPLGVLLPNGLGLNIDGTDMGRVAFVRCLPNGCIAEVVMDDALIQTLSNGQSAIFIVFKTPEEGVGIPVSLNGFKEGYAALP